MDMALIGALVALTLTWIAERLRPHGARRRKAR
jgi:hypothetical protein